MTETPGVQDSPFGRSDRSPQPNRPRFVCPTCDAFAAQKIFSALFAGGQQFQVQFRGWTVTICESCSNPALWRGFHMEWPVRAVGPAAHADMPDQARAIFDEARQVGNASPRAAAALLRVCVEILVDELEPGSGTLNAKVGNLVRRGLPEQVQQAMDTLRVFGNEAGAHVGEIDLSDDRETVDALFQILNMVVEDVITRRQQLDALYSRIPESKREGIARRDAPNS
jgi:hypothetical protein